MDATSSSGSVGATSWCAVRRDSGSTSRTRCRSAADFPYGATCGRGFGSVRVRATIGGTPWTTSVFPATDGYVLPVKRGARDAEAVV